VDIPASYQSSVDLSFKKIACLWSTITPRRLSVEPSILVKSKALKVKAFNPDVKVTLLLGTVNIKYPSKKATSEAPPNPVKTPSDYL
jgi:hypothetical protein